jgi:hypothetical protein
MRHQWSTKEQARIRLSQFQQILSRLVGVDMVG